MDARRAAEITAALAGALHFAHEQGIVHRDVKPANVMIDKDGQPHLMDFGLARFDGSSGEKLTMDGTILGTPAYMAPEQATACGTETTAASDQYSLGATLYELLTGKTPYSGPPEIVIFNLAHRDPPPPRGLKPEIPPELETICLKAMAKAPAGRYGSCQEMADDLRRWLGDAPIHARPVGATEKLGRWLRQNRLAAGLSACLFVAVTAFAGRIVATGSRTPMAAAPCAHCERSGHTGTRGPDAHIPARDVRARTGREERPRATQHGARPIEYGQAGRPGAKV